MVLGLSPLHACIMYLFDSFEDEYHICGGNSLYMLDKFHKDTFNHTKKVNLHGVVRNSRCSLPQCVI